jgi:hypothetical protein
MPTCTEQSNQEIAPVVFDELDEEQPEEQTIAAETQEPAKDMPVDQEEDLTDLDNDEGEEATAAEPENWQYEEKQ